jgi:hypothetical protein
MDPRPEAPTCADVEALLPLIADGAIDAASDAAVFDHLARCDDCQEALARHDLIDLAIGAGGVKPDAALAPIRYRLPPMVAWTAAAALLAAVTGLGWYAAQGDHRRDAMAQREVISVTTPGDPAHRPYYLIREGDRLDPAQLDFTAGDPTPASQARPDEAVPVGVRY